jgi:hypothetical protein
MINTTTKEIISGTEEELLEYFKNKYNLIEKEVQDVACILNKYEQTIEVAETNTQTPPAQSTCCANKGVQVGNKVTTGIGNLFAGTTWGNK